MFFVLIACGFGLPMPEDIVLISGGILSARGVCDFYLTNVICFFGVMIGDGAVFTMGRVFGPRVAQWSIFKMILTDERNAKVSKVFEKYGDKVVFVARFLPGLRTPIFLSAGRFGVPYWKFLALDGFAALISVPAWIYVGYIFGNNLEELETRLHKYQAAVLVGVVVFIIAMICFYRFKNRLIEAKAS
jgi:membrane protein DedA with SNARE-associated domain